MPWVERGAQGGNSNLLDCPSVDRCILLTNFDVAQGEYLTEGGAIFDGRTWPTRLFRAESSFRR